MSCNLVNVWLTIACKIIKNRAIVATLAKKQDRKKLYFPQFLEAGKEYKND